MAAIQEPVSAQAELARILRAVRARWRLRVVLRGLAIALSATLLAALAAAWMLDRLRFEPSAVTALRIVAWLVALALLGWFLLRPLLARPSDRRVAHYLEEHEPTLDAAVLSAVEAEEEVARGAASPVLARQVAADAVARATAVEEGRRVERPALRTWSGALAAAVVGAAIAVALAPPGVRQGLATLFAPWSEADAASPYAVMVRPGDITVARGGDLEITARLRGFASEQVEVAVRRGAAQEFERISMLVGRDSAHVIRLFDVAEPAEYFVEANGVRSPAFRIAVSDLPYTKAMRHVLVFPAYTGLPQRNVEEGGDVATLRGTTVRMIVTPTTRVSAARIVVEGRDPIALAPQADGTLTGAMGVDRPGFYHIEMRSADGDWGRASLDYTIDVLDDQPPTIRMVRPGGDVKVSPVDEVFLEAAAEDDYGVGRIELRYSVNGGAERTVTLHEGARARREASGSHTLYLEELGLQPGDVVAYHARVTDLARGGDRSASTDLYFLEIRPFDREYQQAEQGGGGGGGDPTPGELTEQQRLVISATFKANRDRARLAEREFRENVSTVALAQGRLREQVQTLVRRMQERGVAQDSTFRIIAEALGAAEREMRAAEEALARRDAEGALPAEQRALQQLQKAEAAYRRVQVQMGQQGGGGQGQQQRAEDLADLFELETDRMRNQYESVQRERQEQADQQVDEVLERLRQLAARQQQENERLRRAQQQAASGSQQSGGGGGGQRELAQQAEEAARQLERLSRENRSPELAEAARRLKESADAMRRSASSDRQGSASDAAKALNRLQEARRLLDESRDSRAGRDTQELQRLADALAEQQRGIQRDVEKAMKQQGGLQQERLMERKDQLAAGIADLERRLDESAREQRREQPETSRRLQEAANAIRDGRVRDKVLFSKGVVQQGSPEYARNWEEQIATSLEDVRDRIRSAGERVGQSRERQLAGALDRARDLVRGMESTDERLQERSSAPGSRPSADSSVGAARRGQRQGRPGGEPGQEPAQQQGQRQGRGAGQQPAGGRAEGGGARAEGQPGGQQGALPGQPGSPGRLGGSGQGASGGAYGAVPFAPEEMRQLAREMRERRGEADQLRRELARQGVDVRELERAIERMRQLERSDTFDDPEELARLHGAVVEGLKSFEFTLRRTVEGAERDRLVLGGSDEVPPGFRQLVEEYYRSLARKAPK